MFSPLILPVHVFILFYFTSTILMPIYDIYDMYIIDMPPSRTRHYSYSIPIGFSSAHIILCFSRNSEMNVLSPYGNKYNTSRQKEKWWHNHSKQFSRILSINQTRESFIGGCAIYNKQVGPDGIILRLMINDKRVTVVHCVLQTVIILWGNCSISSHKTINCSKLIYRSYT